MMMTAAGDGHTDVTLSCAQIPKSKSDQTKRTHMENHERAPHSSLEFYGVGRLRMPAALVAIDSWATSAARNVGSFDLKTAALCVGRAERKSRSLTIETLMNDVVFQSARRSVAQIRQSVEHDWARCNRKVQTVRSMLEARSSVAKLIRSVAAPPASKFRYVLFDVDHVWQNTEFLDADLNPMQLNPDTRKDSNKGQISVELVNVDNLMLSSALICERAGVAGLAPAIGSESGPYAMPGEVNGGGLDHGAGTGVVGGVVVDVQRKRHVVVMVGHALAGYARWSVVNVLRSKTCVVECVAVVPRYRQYGVARSLLRLMVRIGARAPPSVFGAVARSRMRSFDGKAGGGQVALDDHNVMHEVDSAMPCPKRHSGNSAHSTSSRQTQRMIGVEGDNEYGTDHLFDRMVVFVPSVCHGAKAIAQKMTETFGFVRADSSALPPSEAVYSPRRFICLEKSLTGVA